MTAISRACIRRASFWAVVTMLLLAGHASAQITTTLSVPEICASPGDTVITLPIDLDNPDVIVRALNFTLHMSSPELALTGVACTSRTLNYLCDANQVGNDVNVVLVTTGTGTVLGTSGAVVELTFSDADTPCTLDSHVDLTITTATVVDNSMPDPQPVPTNLVAGGFTCGCPLVTTTTTVPTFTTTITVATTTSTTTSSSTSSSSTSTSTTSTSTSSTTSTSVEGTTTTSISVTTTTSSSTTTSTTSSTSSTST